MDRYFDALGAVEYAIAKAEGDTQHLIAELHEAEVRHDRVAASRISARLDLIKRRLDRLQARQSSLGKMAA